MSKDKYPNIFSPQMEATFIIVQIFFRNARSIENWVIFNNYLRNRAEYRLILSRRGRRPSRIKSDDIPQD